MTYQACITYLASCLRKIIITDLISIDRLGCMNMGTDRMYLPMQYINCSLIIIILIVNNIGTNRKVVSSWTPENYRLSCSRSLQ